MLIFWKGTSSRSKTDGSSVGYHLTPITLSFVLSWSLDFRLLIFLPSSEILRFVRRERQLCKRKYIFHAWDVS